MPFTLEEVVPWGRSFDEYRRMFALTDADISLRFLGCADGPSSFNAEWTKRGGSVVSFDPIYAFPADAIRRRIDATYPQMIHQARENMDEFVWTDDLPDPVALGQRRRAAMNRFLDDYESGCREGRYVTAEFPALPFGNASYDLALCSHFLFLYSEQLSTEFHIQSLRTMMRVATEARVFPLLRLGAKPSPHVEPVTAAMRREGYKVDIEKVDYEFQRGGNRMMRIRL